MWQTHLTCRAEAARALPAPRQAQSTGGRLAVSPFAGVAARNGSDRGGTSASSRSRRQRCLGGRRPRLPLRSLLAAATAPCSPAYQGVSERDLAEPTPGFDSIADALAALAAGELVVVLDDEDRENEGDLIGAADRITPAGMAFVVNHSSGVVCVGMEGADLDRLRLPLMVPSAENEEAMATAFTVTVDLREGTSTGISAADRAATLRALADPKAMPEDFKRPGHIFPLRARPGGVLRRPGHTEASVDLCRLAGCRPAGVLCEIVNSDGTMARTPQLRDFAAVHGLRCITIADLVRYRLRHDALVERSTMAPLSTRYGHFTAYAYRSVLDGTEHVALVAGQVADAEGVLTRVHSESMLGDLFGAAFCESGSQLDGALEAIAAHGQGVLVYLRGQQGRGLGLADELRAHADAGACASPAEVEDAAFPLDTHDYGVAAHILHDLGVASVALITANPAKVSCLQAHGIGITQQLVDGAEAMSNGVAQSALAAAAAAEGAREGMMKGHGAPRTSRNGCEAHFV